MEALLVSLVLCSLAAASVSLTLTKAKVSAGFRKWVEARSNFFSEVLRCPYCTSHYVGVFFFALTFWGSTMPIVLAVTMYFSSISLSAFWMGLIIRAFRGGVHAETSSDSAE